MPGFTPSTQASLAIYLLMACVLYIVSAVAPPRIQRDAHAWLLSAVLRAPLFFQPALLLCTPIQAAYQRVFRRGR
jgi:hypothetical protein